MRGSGEARAAPWLKSMKVLSLREERKNTARREGKKEKMQQPVRARYVIIGKK